ncbi:MAG: hypothetical protein MR938_00270 [Tenericutes bacterium]|nr:hypothetical protein [Mycoplasmatota bacterium]
MKKFNYLLFTVLISFMFISVDAIDITKKGEITGEYTYGDKIISDATAYLYKVGDLDTDGNFTYRDEFNTFTDNINNLNASEYKALVDKVNKHITDNNIDYIKTTNTDSHGLFKFDDLVVGVYLVKIDDKIIDEKYTYSSSPLLISVPTYDEVRLEENYNVLAVLKATESIKEEEIPKTFDSIVNYIIIGVVSFIIVVGIVIYFVVKKESKK